MRSRLSELDDESGDSGEDKDIDSCTTSSKPSKFTVPDGMNILICI